ncbi:hypothetical protein INR49_001380 [Caranx melampygus]|nr:hypothetical protein INR49_001380 [Caranx melampygus]
MMKSGEVRGHAGAMSEFCYPVWARSSGAAIVPPGGGESSAQKQPTVATDTAEPSIDNPTRDHRTGPHRAALPTVPSPGIPLSLWASPCVMMLDQAAVSTRCVCMLETDHGTLNKYWCSPGFRFGRFAQAHFRNENCPLGRSAQRQKTPQSPPGNRRATAHLRTVT